MNAIILIASIATGFTVWTEDSLTNVYATSQPDEVVRHVELEAARGEWESFQVLIRTGEQESGDVRVQCTDLEGEVPSPNVYRVGYATVAKGPTRPLGPLRFPDVLIPAATQSVAPEQTVAFWITYSIPFSAKPGSWEGTIDVVMGDDPAVTIPVTIHVLGFSIPGIPSLRTLVPLNRDDIAACFDLNLDSLSDWAPIYDDVAPFRLSFSPDATLRTGDGPALPEPDVEQKHLDYLGAQAPMNTIDIGAGLGGLAPLPRRDPDALADPLQVFLYDMGHWIRQRGWAPRGVVVPARASNRSGWQDVREASFRIHEAEPRITRLLVEPLHPFFERYTDAWAIPISDYNFYAFERLRDGKSLHVYRPATIPVVTASGEGTAVTGSPIETRPEDAFDGSFFSHWVSNPAGEGNPWLRIDLSEPIETEEFAIGWVPGWEAPEVRVRTSFDGRSGYPAAATWVAEPAADRFQPSWSHGRFDTRKHFVSLVLEFCGLPPGGCVAVEDILLTPSIEESPAPLQPLQLWLQTSAGIFPNLGIPAPPIEARILPWLCWTYTVDGFVHSGGAHWPSTWNKKPYGFPSGWPTEQVLVYPWQGRVIPSVRLMRLRDGMEDFEFFRTLDQMMEAFHTRDRDLLQLRKHGIFPTHPTLEELGEFTRALQARRNELANAMNDLLKVDSK